MEYTHPHSVESRVRGHFKGARSLCGVENILRCDAERSLKEEWVSDQGSEAKMSLFNDSAKQPVGFKS